MGLINNFLTAIAIIRLIIVQSRVSLDSCLLSFEFKFWIISFLKNLVQVSHDTSNNLGAFLLFFRISLHLDCVGCQISKEFTNPIKALVTNHQKLHFFLLPLYYFIEATALSLIVLKVFLENLNPELLIEYFLSQLFFVLNEFHFKFLFQIFLILLGLYLETVAKILLSLKKLIDGGRHVNL